MSLRNGIENPGNCDAIRELIPDYAFGLTSEEETRFVEMNLANCPEAVAQLADYRGIQSDMRADVCQMELPPQLGARLMSAIAAEPAKTATTPAATTTKAQPAQPVTPTIVKRRAFPLAWAAAAAAVVLLLLSNIYWLNRVNTLERENIEIPTQVGAAVTFTTASDLRWVRLPSSQEDVRAWALLMWNAESQIGLLCVQNFPQLEAGRTYQLWFTHGEEPVSAGTFEVSEDGSGVLVFTITEPIDGFAWSRITEEPEAGSATPTGNMLVNGEL